MKLYKLTNKNGCTQGNTQWGIGVTHELKATEKPRLCTKDVLHAYKNINLASFSTQIMQILVILKYGRLKGR